MCKYFVTYPILMICWNLLSLVNSQSDNQISPYNGLTEFSCEDWIDFSKTATITNNNNCTQFGNAIYCIGDLYNLNDISLLKIKKVETLTICNYPNTSFDAHSLLKNFSKLKSLKIEISNFTHINNDFPELHYLETINITNTLFAHTRPTLFKRLSSLKYLDLRRNKLDHLEGPLILSSTFEGMFLSGNPWNCIRNMKWLLSFDDSHVLDKDLLQCVDYKYSGRPLLAVMDFKQILRDECLHSELKNCTCSLTYIRPSEEGDYLIPMYSINCSYLQVDKLPGYLPKNTTTLYITHNKISNLEPLRTNSIYAEVQDLYLDYNSIDSIELLEGEYWLNNFRVFSLRGNKLTKLPVYALDNALERNHNAIQLFLSHNPWRCDCHFTLRFQEFLMKYKEIVQDSYNITCKHIEGDENFHGSVMLLKPSDVCILPTEYYVQALDLLNGILGSLIVLVLAKLGYDYYHYKRYGKLPWIVTKLP